MMVAVVCVDRTWYKFLAILKIKEIEFIGKIFENVQKSDFVELAW
jgi:hypothetical protein